MQAHDHPWGSIAGRSAQTIAADIRTLIEDDVLTPGTRLPTIRSLATTLGVSPTTVTEAWSRLLAAGIIRTEGRRGTFVSPRAGKRRIETAGGSILMDLAQGGADPTLQPSLRDAFLAALESPGVNSYDFAYMTDELRAAIEPTWPYRAPSWTTADGAMDASALVVRALIPRGAAVAVEQPTSQRAMALLRQDRRSLAGVHGDADGPDPAELEHAIRTRAVAAFYWQPRVQYPIGRTVTPGRVRELAEVLAAHPSVVVIEDDLVGAASAAPERSLGRYLPDAVVHIRSHDTAYGVDLRTAVISGSSDNIRAVNLARGMLAVWNSRILQNALAWLLGDPATRAALQLAARRYRQRRTALTRALSDIGLDCGDGDGPVLWVPVHEEVRAVDLLDADRVVSGLGSVCWLDATDRRHVRVPVGQVGLPRSERVRVAAAIARAAAG